MPGDTALLRLEAATLWEFDERGRLTMERRAGDRVAPDLVIARAVDGQFAIAGAAIPDDVSGKLVALAGGEPAPYDVLEAPRMLGRCTELLQEHLGVVECRSGPSYLVANVATTRTSAPICTSASGLPREVAVPPGWHDNEWRDLLDGRLGPWALALIDHTVVSLCHSARLTCDAAEAGVWTDPGFRGQGYAASVTAAWASLFADGGSVLFYSTGDDNLSSQRVAAQLGLRRIGRMWQLSKPGLR